MAIKTEDYEGQKSYVCTDCRGLFQTFDKAAAEAHDKAGEHPFARGVVAEVPEEVKEK